MAPINDWRPLEAKTEVFIGSDEILRVNSRCVYRSASCPAAASCSMIGARQRR